jgi:hypothetical protein
MAIFENILESKPMRDKVILQLGKSLYNIDPSRKIFKSYNDLPSVGTSYCLIEYLPVSLNGISSYGSEVYESDTDEYTEDTVISQTASFRITAANDNPYDFLNDLVISRHTEDFWWEYFNKEDISINTVSDIVDSSLPTEGGDWEERWSINITLSYLSKTSKVVNTVDKITGSVAVADSDINIGLTGEIPDQ